MSKEYRNLKVGRKVRVLKTYSRYFTEAPECTEGYEGEIRRATHNDEDVGIFTSYQLDNGWWYDHESIEPLKIYFIGGELNEV